jgi:hypothetical protein
MNTIGIYCLGHRRQESFIFHARELAKCKFSNFHFYILSTGISLKIIDQVKKILNNRITIIDFQKENQNYLDKIHFAVNNKHTFSVKLDEDCFMTSESWSMFLESHSKMNDDDLLFSGCISNGIPTVDLFLENHAQEIKDLLFNRFAGIKFDSEGINYARLNTDHTYWDPTNFYERVSNFPHFYKGIHPVRIDFDSVKIINDYIISNFATVMKPKKSKLLRDTNTFPYFCNSIFMIRTDDWYKIINSHNLFVDVFDEVPINQYKIINNKNFLFDLSIPIIHTMYNWTPNWDYENKLIESIGYELSCT